MKIRIEHLDESSLSLKDDKIQNPQDIEEVLSPIMFPELDNSPCIKKREPPNKEEAKQRFPMHEVKKNKAPCLSNHFLKPHAKTPKSKSGNVELSFPLKDMSTDNTRETNTNTT